MLMLFIIKLPKALTPENISPSGIAHFTVLFSFIVSFLYKTALSFGNNHGMTFSILYVMIRLMASILLSNFLYLYFYWVHTTVCTVSSRNLVMFLCSICLIGKDDVEKPNVVRYPSCLDGGATAQLSQSGNGGGVCWMSFILIIIIIIIIYCLLV